MSNLQESFANSTVIVSGGCGFLGQHLSRALTTAGARVLLIDRNPSLSGNQVITGDITELNFVKDCVREASQNPSFPLKYVFHLAAQTSIPTSISNPYLNHSVNILGTLNFLEACRSHASLQRLVLSSTYSVRQSLDSPYATSKDCCERLALSYYKSFSVPVSIGRFANIFGPGQNQDSIISYLIKEMNHSHIVKVGNTAAKRDFLYVEDAAQALMYAAHSANTVGHIVNIGSGVLTSIESVIGLISELMAFSGKVEVDQNKLRIKDSNPELPQDSLLNSLTAWKPTTDLSTGIKKTIASIKGLQNV